MKCEIQSLNLDISFFKIFMVVDIVMSSFFIVMITIFTIERSTGQVSVVFLFAIFYMIILILLIVQLVITSRKFPDKIFKKKFFNSEC